MDGKVIRIGCGAGFWGDTPEGPAQLIDHGQLDYLVLDYLAEITMSILARMHERDTESGYATDFVTHVVSPHARKIAAQGLRIVVNAGGVNPVSCKKALEKEIAAQGLSLRVAAVLGDDVKEQLESRRERVHEMYSGERLPEKITTANAYLGAFPIAAALDSGADIVVTGRCVDSALVLGPLIHEFGWRTDQYDLLAAGSLAGHIIECGTQCTGGFLTDWSAMQATWENIGFPIVECSSDGSFIVTKVPGTGGGVTRETVAEQITYEIGDPRNYVLPDVVCDFADVTVREAGPDRIVVSGASGKPATPDYKVSVTYQDGYRCTATLLIRGREAAAKAQALAGAVLARCRRLFAQTNSGDFSETSIELLGTEDGYGPHANPHARQSREVLLKLAVRHANAKALAIFAREIFPTATSTVQGISGLSGGRPKVQPVFRLFSTLLGKECVPVRVIVEDEERTLPQPTPAPANGAHPASRDKEAVKVQHAVPDGITVCVRLRAIAYARSGDKGDSSNIAVLARRPEFIAILREQVTSAVVQQYFAYLMDGPVERYEWPGLYGFNYLLHRSLGGGGVASLRFDPQGKAYAQILLDLPVTVPLAWRDEGWLLMEQSETEDVARQTAEADAVFAGANM